MSKQSEEPDQQNDMFSNSNGLNDSNNEQIESIRSDSPFDEKDSSSLVDEAPKGPAALGSEDDDLFKDSTQTAEGSKLFDGVEGVKDEEATEDATTSGITEGAATTEDGVSTPEANNATQVASAELNNPPLEPLGDSLPSSDVVSKGPPLEGNTRQEQPIIGGAKSKRHRRTIRKSKKGHKYKYRYVY
jgi:hypothetical protein